MPFDQNFSTKPPYAGSGNLDTTPSNVVLPAVATYPVPSNVTLPSLTPDLPTSLDNEDKTYFPTTSAVYGIPLQWKVSDLGAQGTGYAEAVKFLDKVSTNTTSAPVNVGARGVQVLVQFFPNMSGGNNLIAAAMSCNVTLYTYNPVTSVSTPAFTWTNVTPGDDADELFAGNLEEVDLAGAPLSVGVTSVVGGSVSVYIVPLS